MLKVSLRTSTLLVALTIATAAHALPSFHEVKNSYKKSDAVLLDRHGEVIHELRIDPKGRRLEWVALKDVSPSLIKAVIHSEDRRFYEHAGVDWRAVGASAVKNLFTDNRRGASTITMQVASRLEKGLAPKQGKRSLGQKWDQIKAAGEIERMWSKKQILEAYLNLITFRGELQGIVAASRGLFDKEPGGLDESESVILAALIRSPNASVIDVASRGCILASAMKTGTSCDAIKGLTERALSGPYRIRPAASLAYHPARLLLNKETKRVVSTIDGRLQSLAAEALKHQLDSLKDQNVNDGAVLVVENGTGDILAYVSGSGKYDSHYVDGVKAKRQAGSTLKPFLYEIAVEKRILTAASILDDLPLNVATSSGLYVPQNYDKEFKGAVTVRTALSSSLNIPAVKTLMLVGPEPFVNRLRRLGIDLPESGDYYGYSLALGSADVSLYELVNAYRTIARGGKKGELRFTPDKKAGESRVMKPEAAFIISDILSDRQARSVTFGLENPLSPKFWTAVKTGTSKDMRDNWCIGYSSKYTVGAWVGNFSGEPMWNVSGITGAAPVWLEIMNHLHRNSKSLSPGPPLGVTASTVEFQQGMEPSRKEWFIRGTDPAAFVIHDAPTGNTPRISYPSDGSIIALDPDIPEGQQMIFFEAEAADGLEWVINNEVLRPSKDPAPWELKPGRFMLALTDKQGKIIDAVKFEVRGSERSK